MWQRESNRVLNYINLILKKDLTEEQVAQECRVSVVDVKHKLNLLKNFSPMLYEQVQKKLNS